MDPAVIKQVIDEAFTIAIAAAAGHPLVQAALKLAQEAFEKFVMPQVPQALQKKGLAKAK